MEEELKPEEVVASIDNEIPKEWIEELAMDRTIDPGQLDVECVKQSDLFFKWAERLVEADWITENRDLKRDIVASELNIMCRSDPDKMKILTTAKPTEGLIKSAVIVSDRYKKANLRYFDARKRRIWLMNAVAALEQKKRMLEVLCQLHGQEYFAGPSTPHNLVDVWKERSQRDRVELENRMVAIGMRTDITTLQKRVRIIEPKPKVNDDE